LWITLLSVGCQADNSERQPSSEPHTLDTGSPTETTFEWAEPVESVDPATWYGGAVVAYDVDWAGQPLETLGGWGYFREAIDQVESGSYGNPPAETCSTLDLIDGWVVPAPLGVGDELRLILDDEEASVPNDDGRYYPVVLPVNVPWGVTDAIRATADGDDLPAFAIGPIPFPHTPIKVLAPPMIDASIPVDALVLEWEPGTPPEDVHISLSSDEAGVSMLCTATDDGHFQVPRELLESRFPTLPDMLRIYVNRGVTQYFEIAPEMVLALTGVTRTYGLIYVTDAP